jgi:hypothetical protein
MDEKETVRRRDQYIIRMPRLPVFALRVLPGKVPMRGLVVAALLVCALATVACQNSSNDLPGIPVTPVPMTETFTGTVAVGGLDFKPFTVTISGTVSATLTAVGPNPLAIVVLGIGTPSATTCALVTNGATTAQASTTAQLSGSLTAGSYCVQVQDIQNLGPLTYSVTVVHP